MLAGIPLTAAALGSVALLLYAALALPWPGWRTVRWLLLGVGLAVALKLLAAALLAQSPQGLAAAYWAGATFDAGPAERSTDALPAQSPPNVTRIDPTLDLHGEDFAVHFFNDAARFNFGPDVLPGRDQLPFVVRWTGYLDVPVDGPRRIAVDARGPAQVWVDDQPLPADGTLQLTRGLHPLRVEYSRPEARVPELRVAWQRLSDGPLVPLGGDDVRWRPDGAPPVAAQVLDGVGSLVLGGVIVAWLALGIRRVRGRAAITRALLGLIPLVFLLQGMLLHWPLLGRTTILSGLDDWLVYESSARDIQLHGLLMDGGQGRATPFYGQPFYPYVLALVHRLTGESLFGPLALQFAALGLVIVGTGLLARQAYPRASAAGAAGTIGMLVLVQLEAEHVKVARQLFNENLYMPLVMASLIAMVMLARRSSPPAWWLALATGLLLGLTAIARSQFLLFIPCGALVLLLAWRARPGAALLALVVLGAGVVLAIAPVTWRNYVVSGQVVPISSSGGASLLEFHRPPAGLLDQGALQRDPLYSALGLDQNTRTVIGFARADPGGYLATLLPLGAHSVGLQGRNDPGIYWPLLVTCLLYVASVALPATRRRWVWPIHAFVGTHLLVLMLFEADTYGYRLVVPMYAPMMAVAAQVPVVLGARLGQAWQRSSPTRPMAWLGAAVLGVVAVTAVLWQGRTVIDGWALREPTLHGLGGPAAHAALTADRLDAESIYVASVDGTPRRFGAGVLTGLRYPWFKWFDPQRTLPIAAGPTVYMLSEVAGRGELPEAVRCLGAPDASGELTVADGQTLRAACTASWPPHGADQLAVGTAARVEQLRVPDSGEAGRPLDAWLLWRALITRPEPQQLSLQLDDPQAPDGPQVGNGTAELYPASQWQPGELLLSRLPIATDPTALPQAYRLTLGIDPVRGGAGGARLPAGTVTLTPGSAVSAATLPTDLRPVEGAPLQGLGLELLGSRPLPAETAVGAPLRLDLVWRAMADAPAATELSIRLIRPSGDVAQTSTVPLLGGRLAPSALKTGNVVRDEPTIVVNPRVPPEPLAVELQLGDATTRLGTVQLTGRPHVFEPRVDTPPLEVFGGAMDLLEGRPDPAAAKPGDKVTVRLRWRAAAEMPIAYKVFVHVLDPMGQQVVAQRDAEPRDGGAPTTGWVPGELLEDEYAMTLPADLPPGEYPIELGVYDPRGGARLPVRAGGDHVLLAAPLRVSR